MEQPAHQRLRLSGPLLALPELVSQVRHQFSVACAAIGGPYHSVYRNIGVVSGQVKLFALLETEAGRIIISVRETWDEYGILNCAISGSRIDPAVQ